MNIEKLSVGDLVRITDRPVGRGPMVGSLCRVLRIGNISVTVEDKDTGGQFVKHFTNVEPLDADLRLDAGL